MAAAVPSPVVAAAGRKVADTARVAMTSNVAKSAAPAPVTVFVTRALSSRLPAPATFRVMTVVAVMLAPTLMSAGTIAVAEPRPVKVRE